VAATEDSGYKEPVVAFLPLRVAGKTVIMRESVSSLRLLSRKD